MKLSKAYEPEQYESTIYELWEKSKAFTPKAGQGKGSFSIVVPPPNANGNLHLGHGLTLAIEDILVRYHRLKGDAALLLPGADHAGFETQVVYEKQLAKEMQKLEKQMLGHAQNLEFEKAARVRDQLAQLKNRAFGLG